MEKLDEYKTLNGFDYIIEGTNKSDLTGHRPGYQALKEKGILSPHIESGLSKPMIREIARIIGLESADKPSSGCLATRIPYTDSITEEKLNRIQEAESIIRVYFPTSQIRVRDHGVIARIEIYKEDISKLVKEDLRKDISNKLKKLGYKFVTLDLLGYREGSFLK